MVLCVRNCICLVCSLLKLPRNIRSAHDLLAEAQVKKVSALKSSQKQVDAKVGPVLTVRAKHTDGLKTELQVQVRNSGRACLTVSHNVQMHVIHTFSAWDICWHSSVLLKPAEEGSAICGWVAQGCNCRLAAPAISGHAATHSAVALHCQPTE